MPLACPQITTLNSRISAQHYDRAPQSTTIVYQETLGNVSMSSKSSPDKSRAQPPEHPTVLVSRSSDSSNCPVFQVTLRLGEALRRVKRPKVFLNLREGVVSIRGELSAHDTNSTHPKNLGPSNPAMHSPLSSSQHSQLVPTQADAQTSSDSEIEILEVRPARKRRYYNPGSDPSGRVPHGTSQSYYTESDLSSLDEELNEALSTESVAADIKATQTPKPSMAVIPPYPKLFIAPERSRSPPPPGYRNIPPNLMNAIHREMNIVFDGFADDDIEVVGKRTFSLKDPIARTKIKLPIKATTCRHFECFDFFNFCLFYKLPPGTRGGLKRSLVLQSKEARETEQLFLRQQRLIQSGKLSSKAPGLVFPQFSENGQMFFTDLFSRTPPLYKCPLCDEKFGLKQLYISDIFNFFVKTTPLHTTKIMLVENDRYKIVEEEKEEQEAREHEVVELSGDDEDEELPVKLEKPPATSNESAEKNGAGEGHEAEQTKSAEQTEQAEQAEQTEQIATDNNVADESRSMTGDDFNDGLDDFLSTIAHGDGSWENPMTLD